MLCHVMQRTYSSWVKYEVLPEVGHFVHLEAPEQVLRAVKELVSVPLHHLPPPAVATDEKVDVHDEE
jgi:hypothetical protein